MDEPRACFKTELYKMWQQQIGADWVIAEASGRMQENGNTVHDLDIIGVVQACTGPGSPDINRVFAADSWRVIRWEPESLLVFGGAYEHEPADGWREEYSDWLLWRLAARSRPIAVPRWQWWRSYRSVWLPSPFLAKSFEFRCAPDAVKVENDNTEVARWVDWTYNLREMTTANITPSTGQMLLIRRSLVEREAARLGGVFAWLCKVTTYDRKYSYQPFNKDHFALDFGTTRIVR
ncbi:MAG: hypothetical protein WD733_03090 [Bryobacterales bacterium]